MPARSQRPPAMCTCGDAFSASLVGLPGLQHTRPTGLPPWLEAQVVGLWRVNPFPQVVGTALCWLGLGFWSDWGALVEGRGVVVVWKKRWKTSRNVAVRRETCKQCGGWRGRGVMANRDVLESQWGWHPSPFVPWARYCAASLLACTGSPTRLTVALVHRRMRSLLTHPVGVACCDLAPAPTCIRTLQRRWRQPLS